MNLEDTFTASEGCGKRREFKKKKEIVMDCFIVNCSFARITSFLQVVIISSRVNENYISKTYKVNCQQLLSAKNNNWILAILF